MQTIRFNHAEKADFFRELNKRVNDYFKENNISKYANAEMKIKTIFMLSLYFAPFILMLIGMVTSTWAIVLMWVLMGFGMSGIGLSVMHDANHGAYSKRKWVNNILGFTSNFLGANDMNWRIQHNVLHHSYTNIEGMDEDINIGFIMRFSPHQQRRKLHQFQLYYAWFLYGFLTMNWFVAKDFAQLKNYKEKDLLKAENKTYGGAFFEILMLKVGYVLLTLVLPIILLPIPWWGVVLCFMLMHFICGLILSLIFQPAHVLSETDFFEPDADGNVENNWAIHQMRTTSNFAQGSKWFSWFVGGLNFQVEHHLFRNICHVHYRKIAKIVKETADEFQVPYHSHKTFFHALKSHFTLLNNLGKGVI
jgi:linoleoyl-CoA desaturase